jgi:hypothetical protein
MLRTLRNSTLDGSAFSHLNALFVIVFVVRSTAADQPAATKILQRTVALGFCGSASEPRDGATTAFTLACGRAA